MQQQQTTEIIEISGTLGEFRNFYQRYITGLENILRSLDVESVEALAQDLLNARAANRQIFIFGNGGSAANASHMANDLSKQRFESEELLFRVISLTDNVSWITATANDVGYDDIFVNQLKNLLQPNDLVIAISSSGNSRNIVCGVEYANAKGAITWGVSGFDGGELKKCARKSIHIPTKKGQYGFHEDVTSVLSHIISVYLYERDRDLVEP